MGMILKCVCVYTWERGKEEGIWDSLNAPWPNVHPPKRHKHCTFYLPSPSHSLPHKPSVSMNMPLCVHQPRCSGSKSVKVFTGNNSGQMVSWAGRERESPPWEWMPQIRCTNRTVEKSPKCRARLRGRRTKPGEQTLSACTNTFKYTVDWTTGQTWSCAHTEVRIDNSATHAQ